MRSGSAHQARLRALATAPLAELLARTTAQGERAWVDDADHLRALGLDGRARPAQRDLARARWNATSRPIATGPEHGAALELLLEQGCLARRILHRVGEKPEREALAALYRSSATACARGACCVPSPERSIVLTCEHGGHRVPRALPRAVRGLERALSSHRGWDAGALDVARRSRARVARAARGRDHDAAARRL